MINFNMNIAIRFLLVTLQLYIVHGSGVPIVEVHDGILSGIYYSVANGRIINAFLGVPYAAAPTESNRFKEPQPVKPWVGTWNASQYGSPCLQYTHYGYNYLGEEDCLFLNIYTPKLPVNGISDNLDVIVYIHGGCLMYGTGNPKRPDYLLSSQDVVFVTINYRLGPLGFFSTGDEVVPGNNGHKDQVAALKWIQRNIGKFSGNPNSVTISGMSAGGASVHYHFISPLSEGLFHRGIAQSGSLLMPWTFPKNVPEKCRKIAHLVGCPTESSGTMVDCLRNRPALQIVRRLKDLMFWQYNPYSPIGPVVESGNPNAFLPDVPYKMLHSGRIKNIPLLISNTEDEGLYPAGEWIAKEELLNEIDSKWLDLAPYLLDFNYTVPKQYQADVSNVIRKKYFGDKPISRVTSKQLSNMMGDRLFNVYMIQAGSVQASFNSAPVYYYRFSYRGKNSLTRALASTSDDYGVSHGDDTQYVLKVHYADGNETESDREMVDVMVSMWTSFAKTGIPRVNGVDWKPLSKHRDNFEYLKIISPRDFEILPITNEFDSFKFWSNLLKDFDEFVPNQQHEEL